LAGGTHGGAEGGDDGVGADEGFEGVDLGVELGDCCESDFVAAVLGEEDLLGGEVEVFV
jgi:hypothetical protein